MIDVVVVAVRAKCPALPADRPKVVDGRLLIWKLLEKVVEAAYLGWHDEYPNAFILQQRNTWVKHVYNYHHLTTKSPSRCQVKMIILIDLYLAF